MYIFAALKFILLKAYNNLKSQSKKLQSPSKGLHMIEYDQYNKIFILNAEYWMPVAEILFWKLTNISK